MAGQSVAAFTGHLTEKTGEIGQCKIGTLLKKPQTACWRLNRSCSSVLSSRFRTLKRWNVNERGGWSMASATIYDSSFVFLKWQRRNSFSVSIHFQFYGLLMCNDLHQFLEKSINSTNKYSNFRISIDFYAFSILFNKSGNTAQRPTAL